MRDKKSNKIESLEESIVAITNVMQHLVNEVKMLKSLSVGTLEVVKKMPDYYKALEAVIDEENKEIKNEKKLEIPED